MNLEVLQSRHFLVGRPPETKRVQRNALNHPSSACPWGWHIAFVWSRTPAIWISDGLTHFFMYFWWTRWTPYSHLRKVFFVSLIGRKTIIFAEIGFQACFFLRSIFEPVIPKSVQHRLTVELELTQKSLLCLFSPPYSFNKEIGWWDFL